MKAGLHDAELLLGKANRVTPNILPYSLFPTTLVLLMLSWVMTLCVGHPFGQLGSAVLAVSPPKLWCIPCLLAGRTAWETEKTWMLCKHSWAITKKPLCYGDCFGAQIQTAAPEKELWAKLTLFQLRHVQRFRTLATKRNYLIASVRICSSPALCSWDADKWWYKQASETNPEYIHYIFIP